MQGFFKTVSTLPAFLIVVGLASMALSTCSDSDGGARETPSNPTATQVAAATATGADTATSVPRRSAAPPPPTPTTQPTSAATATRGAAPGADGTVDPMNPGDAAAKNLKPNPSSFTGPAFLVDVRVSFHPEAGGWERIVLELDSAGLPAAAIEYRDPVVLCGSGEELNVPGSRAALVVEMQSTAAHDDEGQLTLRSGETEVDGPPGGTVVFGRQICDFEGMVSWAFALKGERNFKVSPLEDPVRIVVDVKR